jgi:hypothetical protein
MNQKLLFVTSQEENFEAGLNYALDLAKMMGKGIAILVVQKKRLLGKLDEVMSAIAFAEEYEHKAAREFLDRAYQPSGEDLPAMLKDRCSAAGMDARVETSSKGTVGALRDYLQEDRNVELVLLSPSITEEKSFSSTNFKKLFRSISRPIVTMVRQPHGA